MRDPFLSGQTNRLLGYPPDARLLILNADDFGMCHATNAGIIRALMAGVVQSTSLMAPCPWAAHALHWLQAHPDVPFGVHLTAICDSEDYRWGPLTCREHVPSLVDETGAFYTMAHMPAFLAQANQDEIEVEFRAQIERVLAAGTQAHAPGLAQPARRRLGVDLRGDPRFGARLRPGAASRRGWADPAGAEPGFAHDRPRPAGQLRARSGRAKRPATPNCCTTCRPV